MENIPGLNLIPEKYRGTVLLLLALSPYVTRAYYAIINGGGLRGIISSIWLGTNTPQPTQSPGPEIQKPVDKTPGS
jgi:hypothetical protein